MLLFAVCILGKAYRSKKVSMHCKPAMKQIVLWAPELVMLNFLQIYVLWSIDPGSVQVSIETSPVTRGKEGMWFIKAILCAVFLHAVWHVAHSETFSQGKQWQVVIMIIIYYPPAATFFRAICKCLMYLKTLQKNWKKIHLWVWRSLVTHTCACNTNTST